MLPQLQNALAQIVTTDPMTLIDLLSKGSSVVLAAGLVGFVFGWIVPGYVHKAVQEDNKRLQAKVDELNEALVNAVRVTGRAVGSRGRGSE